MSNYTTFDEIADDLQRQDFGDKTLEQEFERLRQRTKDIGQDYIEPLRSKTTGTIKYLLRETPDGDIMITDLDTNHTVVRSIAPQARSKRQHQDTGVQTWIKSGPWARR